MITLMKFLILLIMFNSRKGNRDSRQDFERELNILVEAVKSGKMNFARGMGRSANDLLKVRSSPNNRFDLNTITEMVRTLAMSSNFPRH